MGFVAILLGMTLVAGSAWAQPAPTAPLRVTFRLAADEPVAGWETLAAASGGATCYVSPEVLLDQRAIAAATARAGERGHWIVDVTMTEAGAALLAAVTRDHLGERLAIVVNGSLQNAPVIRSPITGGRACIAGSFTPEEARRLAAAIVATD